MTLKNVSSSNKTDYLTKRTIVNHSIVYLWYAKETMVNLTNEVHDGR